jgi:uncharacterized protein (DUF983 family)
MRAQTTRGGFRLARENPDFRCAHCQQWVISDPLLAGVQHRNHCPHCLWSRHMDLQQAGDRLAACHGAMRPLGLAMKTSPKRYPGPGELMLVHHCTACGQDSLNRLAADDDPQALLVVFRGLQAMPPGERLRLQAGGIHPLEPEDIFLLHARLFGWDAPLDWMKN